MKVLICPLNWGLGHATRVVPIIKLLQRYNFAVMVASGGDSLTYLKKEINNVRFVHFPNYDIKYSGKSSQVLKLFLKIPEIIYCSIKEHLQLKKIVAQYGIDIVISDNRFGLWHNKVYSIFISHQLGVKFPGKLKKMEFIYRDMIRWIASKFNECWIPDLEGPQNLSGELSHLKKRITNSYFIGPLSRFNTNDANKNTPIKYDILFILSGPEPQRTILESIVYEQSMHTSLKCAIVRGSERETGNLFSFLSFDIINSKKMLELINASELIICRSGYSSIMDLIALRKKAVLVPTPGQTEQEYLAEYLKKSKLFYSMNQKDFDLKKAVGEAYEQSFSIKNNGNGILIERILNLKEVQNKITYKES